MMSASLTNILLNLFAYPFYKKHYGLFVFAFVSVVVYFFFIEALNQTHLPISERIYVNLAIVLALTSSPVTAMFFFFLWIIYLIKVRNFVAVQLSLDNHRFLFYSITSFDKTVQLKSWLVTYSVLSLPVICCVLFALAIGVIFHYYVIPLILLLGVTVSVFISAAIRVRQVNGLTETDGADIIRKLTKKMPKPLFSVFFYHLLCNQKTVLLVTKLFSVVLILGFNIFFSELNSGYVVSSILITCVVMAYVVIIFQWHIFENTRLSFVRNFPYSATWIYFQYAATWIVLTFSESVLIFILCHDDIRLAFFILISGLGTALLFRCLLHAYEMDIRKFVTITFYLFVVFFLMFLYQLYWLLIISNFLFSFVIFRGRYYAASAQ